MILANIARHSGARNPARSDASAPAVLLACVGLEEALCTVGLPCHPVSLATILPTHSVPVAAGQQLAWLFLTFSDVFSGHLGVFLTVSKWGFSPPCCVSEMLSWGGSSYSQGFSHCVFGSDVQMEAFG